MNISSKMLYINKIMLIFAQQKLRRGCYLQAPRLLKKIITMKKKHRKRCFGIAVRKFTVFLYKISLISYFRLLFK